MGKSVSDIALVVFFLSFYLLFLDCGDGIRGHCYKQTAVDYRFQVSSFTNLSDTWLHYCLKEPVAASWCRSSYLPTYIPDPTEHHDLCRVGIPLVSVALVCDFPPR